MKSLINYFTRFFIISSLILFSSCERELFDKELILPPITGLYTEISGNINGKLIRQNSPYFVTKDLVVETNDTLIIEPGVILYFNERAKFVIKGFLKAEGTRNQRIYFSAYKSEWNGILFSSSNYNSIVKFCIIEKINPLDENGLSGGISFINSSCTFQNNYFRNSQITKGSLISLLNSFITMNNNIFMNNSFSNNLIHSDNNRLRLNNNVFFNNKSISNSALVSIKKSIFNEVQNNIFYRNIFSEEIKVTESDSTKVLIDYNFFGSTTNDPQFWNFETFRLYYLSPCKDAGNPSPEFNDIDGSRNDQGAYGGPGGNW